MSGKITIKNQSKNTAVIRIEGIIGVPEAAQFDQSEKRVATYDAFQRELENIRAIRAQVVIVDIRSTGGSVGDALLIYEALTALDARIVTRCYGYVASAATIIAQAASRGRREISRNALYLIHRASAGAEGNAGELSQTADLLGKTDERIARIYADASGRAAQHFTALMHENGGKGRWLSPEEVIEKGLADRIIASGKIKNAIRTLLGIAETIPEPTRNEAITELEQEIIACENPEITAPVNEIANLQNRIAELEALNAKLRAKATQTLPKEDPSDREIKQQGNAAAYENDLQQIKSL
jgi:ATP-dependent protease ClpP protease subunit